MARQAGTVIQNKFIKGLITENTALNFPEDACTETTNCVFDETGRITRRGGLDLEDEYTSLGTSSISLGDAFSEFVWDQVAGTGTVTFLVQQEGNLIKFFDLSSDSIVTSAGVVGTIDLLSFIALDTPYDPLNFTCSYAKGNGELIIVNPAIDPIYITYDPLLSTFTATRILIKYRDFIGVQYTSATYTDTYRPLFTSLNLMKTDATSGNNGARHFYNLLNQGWWQGVIASGSPDANSPLGQWDTARGDMPSNSDRVESYRASFTDAFDPSRVGAYDQGNTLAPKGHFILNLGNADRTTALTDAGYSLSYSSEVVSTVPYSTGTNSGDFSNTNYAFNGSTTGTAATSTSPTVSDVSASSVDLTSTSARYVRKNYGGSPIRVYSATVVNSVTYDGSGTLELTGGIPTFSNKAGTSTITFTLYGKTSAPSSGTDGTILGTATRSVSNLDYWTQVGYSFTMGNGTPFAKANTTINSNNTATAYQYVWVRAVCSIDTGATTAGLGGTISQDHTVNIYEVTFKKQETVSGSANLPAPDTTYERPSCTEWFASRAWYAGVGYTGLSNNLYFSQVIEKPEQYGRCYQLNDPTSEALRDILPTDGGIIKIPEVGKIIRLWAYQTALIVFSTNGVWIVRGENGFFTPTSFSVRKISSSGTQSPLSFCDVRGVPTWWGEDGILQINYNPQFDSFSVDNMTDTTIRSLFLGIVPEKRKYVKAAYDSRESIVYWLYNDREDYPIYTYNKVLCLNTLSGAFYPFEFFDAQNIRVNGIVYAVDSVGTSDPLIKFTTSHVIDGATTRLHYCDLKTNSYRDFADFSSLVTFDPDDVGSYESSFTTGYKTDGELLRFVQPNYVMVFLEQEDGASCYMRGVFDFSNSGNSGKWSSAQQIYNNTATNKDVNYKRLKVRGKGRSIQLKFFSSEDSPFTIIGWSAFETSNSEV